MTVDNCIKLLKLYADRIETPPGNDSATRTYVKKQATKAYANMKAHILKCKKFIGHPILAELQPKPKKEVKKDGTKPKR